MTSNTTQLTGDEMKALTITLGRNIGLTPMSPSTWREYVRKVRDRVKVIGGTMLIDTGYRGSWEGMSEDAHVYHVLVPELASSDERWLRMTLASLAADFHQDAIGLAIGDSALISSEERVSVNA